MIAQQEITETELTYSQSLSRSESVVSSETLIAKFTLSQTFGKFWVLAQTSTILSLILNKHKTRFNGKS